MDKKFIILGIVIVCMLIVIGAVILIKDANDSATEEKLLESIKISGYRNMKGEASIAISDEHENSEHYKCDAGDALLLYNARKYNEIAINIYYTENRGNKNIVRYELYNIATNEKIEDVKTVEELEKIMGYDPAVDKTADEIEENEHYDVESYEEDPTFVEMEND